MKKVVHKSDTRGHANHGWLESFHSFSFANYYNPNKMNFGLLRVLNDDSVAAGRGFGAHPHDNMEIISIPLEGDLEHQDNMGNKTVIKLNDVQIMSAGTGVVHSEYNHSRKDAVKFLQIWVFPKEKNIKPRYAQKTFEPADRENKLQLVVSPEHEEAIWINQDAYFSLGKFEAGKTVSYEIHKNGNGAYIFVLDGKVEVDGEVFDKRDAVGVWDTDKVNIKAAENTNFLVIDVPMN
ncbi:MAG: pirin family protein [Saprospiraceae bacterium]|nr:pirin family protein [Saprospiraceae bacterium]